MELSCNEEAFVEAVVRIARENAETLAVLPPRARRKFVRLAVEGSRVSFAVWKEGDAVHLYCLKGRDVLGTGTTADTSAIAVKGMLDAIGIANDFGDGAPHLAHSMPNGVM
jgi:hypothetical protein